MYADHARILLYNVGIAYGIEDNRRESIGVARGNTPPLRGQGELWRSGHLGEKQERGSNMVMLNLSKQILANGKGFFYNIIFALKKTRAFWSKYRQGFQPVF